MKLSLLDARDQYVEVRADETALLRYVYHSDAPQVEAPRPYFHPLRTRAGHEVTGYRPHDHVWHKGLSLTCAQLSGENFWGGPTYVRDEGYVKLPNVGRQEHRAWEAMATGDDGVELRERLRWITQAGAPWIDETRTIRVAAPQEADYWTLGLEFNLRNIAGQPLAFGSPTTAGRPMAGYGGLFWRGPRAFQGGAILTAEAAGPDIMGQRANWLSYTGRHDGVDAASTLVFYDAPANPRHPTQWFVRNTVTMVCAAFMFDEVYTLAPDDTLRLAYEIVIADGAWDRERIAAHTPQFD